LELSSEKPCGILQNVLDTLPTIGIIATSFNTGAKIMQKYRVSFDLVLSDESKLPNDWIGTAIYDNLDVDSGEEYYNLECELVAEDAEFKSESDRKLFAYMEKLVEAGVLNKTDPCLDSYYYWVTENYSLKHDGDNVVKIETYDGSIIVHLDKVSCFGEYVEVYGVLPKDLSIIQHHYVTVEELLN
jgi:hypothetical protein